MPIRLRVTLAFAGVMAVLLAGLGLFVYVRMGTELDATIEQGLRSRAADITALVRESDAGLAQSAGGPVTERGEHLAQIVAPSGDVLDAAPGLTGPLLSPDALVRARRGTVLVDIDRIPGGEDPARLLATPVRAEGRDLVVVVGTPLDDRNDALRNLAGLLALGGPVALLVASLAGYGVAASALRPVERMRRRAAEIQQAGSGQRLPVPAAADEIGRLGETLNGMLERLDAAFARERTFVSDASHELRTPLAILKAELEVALRSGRSADELRAALESAAEETDRLVQLAEDLLVLARTDQQGGALPIRPAPADARDVLDAVAGRFLGRAGRQQAELTVTAEEGLRIDADRLRLEQAVGNLVDNALRHGGRRIELSAAARGDRAELSVRDDGAGFPEEFLEVAFERFTRADSARGRGGTGLGLAIVAAIARAHGGSTGARNLAGGGAEVWIELPAGPPREPGGRRAPDREAV